MVVVKYRVFHTWRSTIVIYNHAADYDWPAKLHPRTYWIYLIKLNGGISTYIKVSYPYKRDCRDLPLHTFPPTIVSTKEEWGEEGCRCKGDTLAGLVAFLLTGKWFETHLYRQTCSTSCYLLSPPNYTPLEYTWK